MAPTAITDSSGSDDDDNVNLGLAIGLGVPLGLLLLFVLVYFTWYQNSCGFFAKSEADMFVPLMEDDHVGKARKQSLDLGEEEPGTETGGIMHEKESENSSIV